MAQEQQQSIQGELARRHRTAAMAVGAFLGLTVALIGITIFASESIYRPDMHNPNLEMALWITILIFGLGSFALRRARFQTMRLKDIAALRGISGLLASMSSTIIQVACIGGAIALMGLVVTIMTGNYGHMLRAGGVAAIVLLSAYPQRSAWQRLVRSIEQQSDDAGDDASAKGIVA